MQVYVGNILFCKRTHPKKYKIKKKKILHTLGSLKVLCLQRLKSLLDVACNLICKSDKCFILFRYFAHTHAHTHTHSVYILIAHPMRPQTRLACVSFNLSSLCSRRLSCLPILICRYAVAFPVFPTLAADFGLKWEFSTYILIQPPTHIHRQAHKSTDLLRLLVLCLTVIFYFFH